MGIMKIQLVSRSDEFDPEQDGGWRQPSSPSVVFIDPAGFRVNSQQRPCLHRDGVGQLDPRSIRAVTAAEARMNASLPNHNQP